MAADVKVAFSPFTRFAAGGACFLCRCWSVSLCGSCLWPAADKCVAMRRRARWACCTPVINMESHALPLHQQSFLLLSLLGTVLHFRSPYLPSTIWQLLLKKIRISTDGTIVVPFSLALFSLKTSWNILSNKVFASYDSWALVISLILSLLYFHVMQLVFRGSKSWWIIGGSA